jgi:hypothetical protein
MVAARDRSPDTLAGYRGDSAAEFRNVAVATNYFSVADLARKFKGGGGPRQFTCHTQGYASNTAIDVRARPLPILTKSAAGPYGDARLAGEADRGGSRR